MLLILRVAIAHNDLFVLDEVHTVAAARFLLLVLAIVSVALVVRALIK
jgi:hypothetical protein